MSSIVKTPVSITGGGKTCKTVVAWSGAEVSQLGPMFRVQGRFAWPHHCFHRANQRLVAY